MQAIDHTFNENFDLVNQKRDCNMRPGGFEIVVS